MKAHSNPGVARRAGAAAAIAAFLLAFSVGGLAIHRAAAASGAADGGGTVVVWGDGGYSGLNVPENLNDVVAVSAGLSFPLALRSSGTVVELAVDDYGHPLPAPAISDVVAIAAGEHFELALKRDGSVVRWSESTPPSPPTIIETDVMAVSNGMLLKRDGTVELISVVPPPVTSFDWLPTDTVLATTDEQGAIAISGGTQDLVLHGDGTVVAVRGPKDVPAKLTNIVAISAGGTCSMALRDDGTIVEWAVQRDLYGACSVPSGLKRVVAISAGGDYSLALESDGSVVAWGNNNERMVEVPSGMVGVKAISAGGRAFAIATRRDLSLVGLDPELIAAAVVPLLLVALAALSGDAFRRKVAPLAERLGSLMPTCVAVALAVLSLPLVALTVHPTVANLARSPATPIDRWLSTAGAVLVSAVVAGTLGGFAVRRIGWVAVFPTFLLALVVAAPASVIVPGVLGRPVAYGEVCLFPIGHCTPMIQSTDPRNAILASPLAVLAPFIEPVAVATLAVGVAIWGLATRDLHRHVRVAFMALESAPPANGDIPGM